MGEHLWAGGRKKEKVGHKVTREKKRKRRRKSKVWNAWKKGENKKGGGEQKRNGKENIMYTVQEDGFYWICHFSLQTTTIRTSIE